MIKTSLNDLKREMEEVRQQGKSLQDKLKEYLKVKGYRDEKEEVDKEVNDVKEIRNDFEDAKQVLKKLNDDKRAMELV